MLAIAIGAIGVAVAAVVAAPATEEVQPWQCIASAPAAASILGVSTTTAAISIAVAGGGVAVLNKLRKYEVVEKHNTYMVLKRKSGIQGRITVFHKIYAFLNSSPKCLYCSMKREIRPDVSPTLQL